MAALVLPALLALAALTSPAGAVKFKVYRGTAECVGENAGQLIGEGGAKGHGRVKVEGEFLVRGRAGATDRKARVDWSLIGPGNSVMGSGQGVLQDGFHVDVQAQVGGEWTMCFAMAASASAASATVDLVAFQVSLPGAAPGRVLGHVDAGAREGGGEDTAGGAGGGGAGSLEAGKKLEGAATASHAEVLEGQVVRLRTVIGSIRLEQRKLSQRDSRHAATIRSTKTRSEAAALVECVVAAAVSLAQILVVRSFFATSLGQSKGRCV